MNPAANLVRRISPELWLTLLVTAIVLAGALLRLYGLDRNSLWNDEAASWLMGRLHFPDMIQASLSDDHPPLYNIVVYETIRLIGDSEIALRLPSTAMGIANIYLIYRLGKVLWDRLTGIFAAALLAFSGFHIWHSQEARMYTLLCLTATVFALATLRYLDRPGRLRAWGCGFAGLLLLYSHPYGAIDWASINLGVGLALLTRRAWPNVKLRAWLGIQFLVALSFLPWLFALFNRLHEVFEQDAWIPFPTIGLLFGMVRAFAGGPAMLCALILLVLVVVLVSANGDAATASQGHDGVVAQQSLLSRMWHGLAWQTWFLLIWAALPCLTGYALCLLTHPILQDRYLIGSLPPCLLLAARGLWLLRSNRFVLAGSVMVLVIAGAPSVYRSIAVDRNEDGRAAAAVFATQFRSSDGVILTSPGVLTVFSYYYRLPVAHEAVVFRPESDTIDWPGVTRVWVFVREGITYQTAPVMARIEAIYQLQREFHCYKFSLYLFVRSNDPGLHPADQVTSK
jgi:mannosyltransferase